MSQYGKTTQELQSAKPGFSVKNIDNGRSVEVTCMRGGRYLCIGPDGNAVKQTHSASVAYHFLTGIANLIFQYQ